MTGNDGMGRIIGKSLGLVAENNAQRRASFPEVATRGKNAFDGPTALPGGELEKRQTRCKVIWNGREEARA